MVEISSEKSGTVAEKHPRSVNKVKQAQIYLEQLLCLMLLIAVSYYNSGMRVVAMVGFAVAGAVLMDMVGCYLSKKLYNPRDLSTIMAGVCIALLMPAGMSYGLVFFASVVTIVVKHIFGGKNNYIFNPTAVAFVFMILCYPVQMLLFPEPLQRFAAWEQITAAQYANFTGFKPIESLTTFDILIGSFTGAMGTVHVLVILVTGTCLLLRRTISPVVTISALAANFIFSGVGGSEAGVARDMLVVLVSGYFLFILVFLANDPQTLPKSFLGRVYYGVAFGGAAVFFRVYGRVEGSPAFALLLVNTMTERMDILAAQTLTNIRKGLVYAKKRLNSYESLRERITDGDDAILPKLSDTQEFEPVKVVFDTPPVENKIIRVNRKAPGPVVFIKEKASILASEIKRRHRNKDKDKAKRDEPELAPLPEESFLDSLVEGVKDITVSFKKKEHHLPAEDEQAAATEAGGGEDAEVNIPINILDPLGMSLLVDDDDVIVIDEVDISSTAADDKKTILDKIAELAADDDEEEVDDNEDEDSGSVAKADEVDKSKKEVKV